MKATVVEFSIGVGGMVGVGGMGGVGGVGGVGSAGWRHVTAACLSCVRTRPPSAHELREAFFAGTHYYTP